MQSDNVILAGSATSNPGSPVQHRAELPVPSGGLVRNLAPTAGEQSTYSINQMPEGVAQGYSIAAFLPRRGRRSVLIAAGTEAQGARSRPPTSSTSEVQCRAFRSRLPRKSSTTFPLFEVLLRTNKWSGGFEVVAYRLVS